VPGTNVASISALP